MAIHQKSRYLITVFLVFVLNNARCFLLKGYNALFFKKKKKKESDVWKASTQFHEVNQQSIQNILNL